MPEPPTNPEPVVYQLRVVLRGVSPLIWRRLLVPSEAPAPWGHATVTRNAASSMAVTGSRRERCEQCYAFALLALPDVHRQRVPLAGLVVAPDVSLTAASARSAATVAAVWPTIRSITPYSLASAALIQ